MLNSIVILLCAYLALCQGKLVMPQSRYSSHVSRKSDSKENRLERIVKIRGGSDWRYFAAGGSCAAISHAITTPIDVVKTKMQSDPTKFKGMMCALKLILKEEGPAGLLKGLGPTFVGYGMEGAIKFGCYEVCKKLFVTLTPHKVVNFLLASTVAGAIASIVLCPMEQTRVKMVSDPTWEHENLLSGIARMITKHGCAGCFQGLAAMLFKQLPYTMTKQVGFDIVATFFRRLAKELVNGNIDDLKFVISTCAAFVAAVLACICSQPGDMILTRTFRNRGVKMTTIARDIYQMNGIGGFYIGLTCRLAHVVSIITCQLVLYDIIKQALGLPVTGSN